jgi:hypothetical protein
VIADKQLLQPYWSACNPLFPIVGGACALLVYLCIAWFVYDPYAVWSPDEGAKLLQIQYLRLEHGSLAYDVAYPGRELDPDLQFSATDTKIGLLRAIDGRLFFGRLPVFPLIELPFFHWLGLRGLYLLPALGGAVCVALSLQLIELRDRRIAMWLVIAFASPIAVYSSIFWEHTFATSLGLACAALALHVGSTTDLPLWRRGIWWTAIGLLLGASIYIRLEMIIFALALLGACWLILHGNRWQVVWAAGAMVAILVPYLPLQHAMFGNAVPDNAAYLFYPLLYLRRAGWNALPELLVGPFRDESIDPGWRGLVWSMATIVAIAASFCRHRARVFGHIELVALAVSAMIAAAFLFDGTNYRSAHGLLFTSPWVVIGLCRAGEVWGSGDRRARVIVLTAISGLIGYIVGFIGLRAGSPHGGLEWGARFAMTLYPLLALIAFWDLRLRRSDLTTITVMAVLGALGMGFFVRGTWTIYQDKQINGALNQAIAQTPETNVVSDLWWLPFNAASIYMRKTIFVATTAEQLTIWVDRAHAAQITEFCLVTLDRELPNRVASIANGHELRVIETQNVGHIQIMRVEIQSSNPIRDESYQSGQKISRVRWILSP